MHKYQAIKEECPHLKAKCHEIMHHKGDFLNVKYLSMFSFLSACHGTNAISSYTNMAALMS
jgi:hypothetical protein